MIKIVSSIRCEVRASTKTGYREVGNVPILGPREPVVVASRIGHA